jgi:hypothetical protein
MASKSQRNSRGTPSFNKPATSASPRAAAHIGAQLANAESDAELLLTSAAAEAAGLAADVMASAAAEAAAIVAAARRELVEIMSSARSDLEAARYVVNELGDFASMPESAEPMRSTKFSL